jgi:hypothetical protein
MTMKRGPQKRVGKKLSAERLLMAVRKVFEKIPTKKRDVRGKNRKITLADSLMSALAMFSLKSPSLLAFDQARNDPIVAHNLKTLFGVKCGPSDTYMREELDEVDPVDIREGFVEVFRAAQRDKLFERYQFLDGYLALFDGTGLFSSDSVHCSNCCEKHHRDGRTTYYHQALAGVIAHPDCRQVIPLCPELISKQDGAEKNDCERRALQRMFVMLKKEHPRLKITVGCDALSANTPVVNEIKSYGHHFIINAKPGANKSLFEWISGLKLQETEKSIEKNHYIFRYINSVPLNDAKDAPIVNFLECRTSEINGKKVVQKTFSWVTDHEITDENVYLLMRGGRARWKIENETFNTLKNHGYQFDHNFGHGNKHLLSVFTLLMMLAFLIDQIQEASCGLFNAALTKMISRRAFWEKIRCYFFSYFIGSWDDLFAAISQSFGVVLLLNTT